MVQGNRHLKALAQERAKEANTSYAATLNVLNANVAEQRSNIPEAFESWLPVFDSLGYGWKCKVVKNYKTDEDQLALYYDKHTFGQNITPGIVLAESIGLTDASLRYLPKQFGGQDLIVILEETAGTKPIVTNGKTTDQLAKAVAKLANKVAFEVLEGKMPDMYRLNPQTYKDDIYAGPEDGIIYGDEGLVRDYFTAGKYIESSQPEWKLIDQH